jgi:polyribonucleotide nucleotidyltransferase
MLNSTFPLTPPQVLESSNSTSSVSQTTIEVEAQNGWRAEVDIKPEVDGAGRPHEPMKE